MDPVALQHIVQAGAVGISVALIFLIWKIYEKCAANTERVIEVVSQNAEAMTQLRDSIEKNTAATFKMSSSLGEISDVARIEMKQKIKKKI